MKKLHTLPESIKLSIDGKEKRVLTTDYIRKKTKQLQEFGYPELKMDEVSAELLAVLSGGNYTVIGMFMEDEVSQ